MSGYRVAVVGASSLLGKELLAVIEERGFPVSRLLSFEADEDDPELPIVDLSGGSRAAVRDEDVAASELDLVFVAARPRKAPRFLTSFMSKRPVNGREELKAGKGQCRAIDLDHGLADTPGRVLSIPFLERGAAATAQVVVAVPHAAAIVLSTLLLRLAASFDISTATAQILAPASGLGPKAIEELQKQTVSLLSFQKFPSRVFGSQLAFNVLPRLGRAAGGGLTALAARLSDELKQYLGTRAVLPSVRVLQAPVFYSMGVSLYVETAQTAEPSEIAEALAGDRVRLHLYSDPPTSPVGVTGGGEILIDVVLPDSGRPRGLWIWAAFDNLRLAAETALEVAKDFEREGTDA